MGLFIHLILFRGTVSSFFHTEKKCETITAEEKKALVKSITESHLKFTHPETDFRSTTQSCFLPPEKEGLGEALSEGDKINAIHNFPRVLQERYKG